MPLGSAKTGRAYQRILSGLNHHLSQGHRVRILTLTSAAGSREWSTLNHHWQTLRKRIHHEFKQLPEYWRLRTFEGQGAGVLHILYVGSYIPHSWLSSNWADIHGAPIVYIQELKARRGSKRIASYMISNYMGHHEVSRQSWSWGWVFRGFVGYWKEAIRLFGFYETISKWRYIMKHSDPKKRLDILFGTYYLQTRLKPRYGYMHDTSMFGS